MLREHRDPKSEIRSTLAGPVELICLDLVIHELERLARSGENTGAKMSRVARDMISESMTEMQAPFGPRDVDLSIVIFALEDRGRVVVATLDKALLETCSKNSIPWLRPRNQSGLIASWVDS